MQQRWDHPRMRGEDQVDIEQAADELGSPPHARGRRCGNTVNSGIGGITPACAGKTRRLSAIRLGIPDHPRMRGEDRERVILALLAMGSPPHARGRPGFGFRPSVPCGITPACAGKTSTRLMCSREAGDHPRMRGEDVLILLCRDTQHGSPPHARGRPTSPSGCPASCRITPACAGKTPA